MAKSFSISLLVFRTLCLIFYILLVDSVTGDPNDYRSLHPVDPSYLPRKRLAQTQPDLDISLYYAEANYEDASHHAATITWRMRYPTIVASDFPEIKSLRCDPDGIHLDFASPNDKLQAQKWKFPLVIVLDGSIGGCAPEEPSQEKYHPFFAESLLQSTNNNQPSTLSLSGYRSRWDILAYEHNIQVAQVSAEKSVTQKNFVDRRRGLQAPLAWQISPSLNFDRQNNNCSKLEIPISLASWDNGSVDMICRNCFVDTNFRLSIYSGSHIITAGIKSITKIIKKLYGAEQILMRLSRSIKKIVVSQFSMLSNQLADALSAFYNRINDLALSTDHEEQNRIKQDLNQAASVAESTGLQLLNSVKTQLDIGISFTHISLRDRLLLIEEIEEITSTTSRELGQAIESGAEMVMNELSLPVCSVSQEVEFPLQGACRRKRKETSARLTGRFRANADIEMSLVGTGEVTLGDITVLSVNLAGIQIPGIVSIGPQARLISHTGLVFTSSATLAFGGDAEWQQIDAMIYGKKHNLHQLNSTNVVFHRHPPRFEINPQQLSLEQHFKPQVTFGIELLLGAQQLLIGIGADMGLINNFQLPNMFSKRKQYCSDGIKYDFNITSQLEGITSVPSSAGFLLSKIFPTFFNSMKQVSSYPLLVAPSLNLVEHCFKLPPIFWSQFNRTLNRVLPSSHMKNLTSSSL